ncbi:MAG: GTPase domain-containing protein [Holophagaceae bacterium]|nr:GTPase domain-containing protein [Holophagaceae bacterium]
MVFFNHATRQMTAKIVYYGPGLCGKTTNLNTIYGKTSQKARGEMVSLNTETDRTLFFDLLPMDVGMVGGFKTKLQLYTVPGQVFYNSTRKLVLKGVDGIVFVVDSQTPMLDACKESYLNLEENLRELGLVLGDIPMVYQWNKRDLRNVVPVDELEAVFNPKGVPSFQSVASDGTGVFETLRGITKLSLSHIKAHVLGESQVAAPVAPPPPPVEVKLARPDIEALTLSDLPSVTDLLDLEDSVPAGSPAGSEPLPDEDDDSGFFIEAPVLPEHPGTVADDIAFLMDDEASLPPTAQPDVEAPPVPEPEPVASAEPVPPPVEVVHEVVEAPEPAAPAEAQAVSRPAKTGVKMDPLAALAALKVEPKRLPKPKALDHKDAINSLMGELTLVGRSGAPSVLRLDVPTEVDGHEIEVVVQLRHQGQVLVEGQIRRPAPGKGSTAKLTVEMKRS